MENEYGGPLLETYDYGLEDEEIEEANYTGNIRSGACGTCGSLVPWLSLSSTIRKIFTWDWQSCFRSNNIPTQDV